MLVFLAPVLAVAFLAHVVGWSFWRMPAKCVGVQLRLSLATGLLFPFAVEYIPVTLYTYPEPLSSAHLV